MSVVKCAIIAASNPLFQYNIPNITPPIPLARITFNAKRTVTSTINEAVYTWEDETEKEETETYALKLDPDVFLTHASKIYFRYPVN